MQFRPSLLAELDQREEFPAAACRVLDEFGLNGYYVPVRSGGRLADFTDLMQLIRTVARRDLTVAIGHGKTFLGAASAWVAAEHEQVDRLGELIVNGGIVSWGLTERGHGSDLLGGELTATAVGDDWRLDGEKWLINNATRSDAVCVLARTDPAGGPRGFSLFLVEKRLLAEGSWSSLPKVPTHGIRGADISGIVFDGAQVPGTALVGRVGDGIETVLKALQLTRTVCVSLSLGAADTASVIALDYARERSLYGRRLIELPRIRRILGRMNAARLVAEATGLMAVRSIHTLPGEMSVTSAVAKALVPELAQRVIDRAAELLGVRGFLTDNHADGRFAKLERDHRVVAIFDGNTAVNRNGLIDQFPLLAAGYRRGAADLAGVRCAAELGAAVPEFDPHRLALLTPRGCSLVQSLPGAVVRIRAQAAEGLLPERVAELAELIKEHADALHRELEGRQRSAQTVPSAAFVRAERYELCYAAAACLQLWLANPSLQEAPSGARSAWRDGLWLQACLAAIATGLGRSLGEDDEAVCDRLTDHALIEGLPTLLPTFQDDVARSAS
ncbi:acyl-CoA dehydrogenase family protein [Streptomyces sp. NPDC056638]|uniref:acyl-CoA dehydrogenase family protein n=1 Tax=Streptomyces sp. NPDC056638 TaxID=3345887 RepID=UPI0036A9EDE7